MGLVVCNATAQDIHCQDKGSALSSLKLPVKVWYLWLPLHPCASSLDAQVLAGLTGSHSWQPQQGTRPGSKANTQFGYTTFIKCFGKFTHHSWDFQGLPNICLMFKHVFTYQRLCAEHLIPTKDFCWPIWNMLLSLQLWNTAFWSHKSCNSPSHPIKNDRMSNSLPGQRWWLPCWCSPSRDALQRASLGRRGNMLLMPGKDGCL